MEFLEAIVRLSQFMALGNWNASSGPAAVGGVGHDSIAASNTQDSHGPSQHSARGSIMKNRKKSMKPPNGISSRKSTISASTATAPEGSVLSKVVIIDEKAEISADDVSRCLVILLGRFNKMVNPSNRRSSVAVLS